MKVKVKDTAKCQKTLEIEVSKEAVSEEFEKYYEDARKNAQIPGFRKGKAPRHLIEQHFADKASDRVLTNLVGLYYQKALDKEKIRPVTMPHISGISFNKGENLVFHAKVDIRPEITLKDYKEIPLKKQKLDVKDAEIEKVIVFLRERYAEFSAVDGRTTKIGDYVVCDYAYSVDGKPGEKRDNIWMGLDQEMFIPGLSQELTDLSNGQTKEFTLVLPKNFTPKEFSGKKAQFSVSIKEIKEKKLPELNDDLAKIVGKNSLDELKAHIREDLVREKESHIRQDMKSQVINYLAKAMPLDVPPSLLEERLQSIKSASRQRLKQQGLKDEQIDLEEKKMEDVFNAEALKQVRTFFILEQIAKNENIVVDEKEMQSRIEMIARASNQTPEQVFKHLQEKNLLENLHWEVWEEKILDFLINNAKVEESAAKA